MSGLRSLNNSMSKRVLNLLELVKLIVWKVMSRLIEFRMDNVGGSGAGCFEVEIWVDTVFRQDLESAEIWSEKVRCSSKIKQRLRAEWVVVREES